MAVQNSLAKKPEKVAEFECNGEIVRLSPAIIREYLVSGGGNVTDQEIVMFLNMCRFQHLNPFLREAYLIKFGNSPATMVTGKEVFTKRAKRNKDYKGFEAGVIVVDQSGMIIERVGTFMLPTDTLVGGWAKVYIDGYEKPMENTVSLGEYIGTKANGEVNSQWAKKPATMIRKVALVQGLREAFPEDFGGLYSQEEIPTDVVLSDTPIQAEPIQKQTIEENSVVEADVGTEETSFNPFEED